jgi:electron transfer flavoprotein beta subunit
MMLLPVSTTNRGRTDTVHMIVCCKQVVDPETPPTRFKIDESSYKVIPPEDIRYVINPFDEQAIEAALRIKDAQGGKVTSISLGANLLPGVVKKPLTMGTDELVLLEDEAFGEGDSWSTAFALAMAIKKIGEVDLIFCGRQASDSDAGQVGSAIAEILGIPSVTVAKKVDVADGKARVERVTSDGFEVVEVSLPALITVSNELGEARYPTIKRVMSAKNIKPTVWTPTNLEIEPSQVGAAGRRIKLQKLFQPVREGTCEIIGGETEDEAAVNLALKLREASVF